MSFKDVESRYNGPQIEQDMLEFWRDNDIFEKSIQQSNKVRGIPVFHFVKVLQQRMACLASTMF